MSEPAKPEVSVYDLTKVVPAGIQLSGLSGPQFDGANYFRQPLRQSSTVEFSTQDTEFVQLEYQLYAPNTAVTGRPTLDGIPLQAVTFPAGKFISNAVQGAFASAGKHQFTLSYDCAPSCAQSVQQYWTKLTVIKDVRVKAQEDTGLATARLWLNAPDSRLKIAGTGPVSFDGVNYRRPIDAPAFTLSWPVGKRALNASFTINSAQPFKVTARMGDAVIAIAKGDTHTPVNPVLSLTKYSGAQAMTVQVECLKGPPGCASLYFPSVSLLSSAPVSAPFALVLAGTLLLVGLLGGLLGLWPRRAN